MPGVEAHARVGNGHGARGALDRRSLTRAAAAGLNAIPLGLGYWWAFWDPERQAWHDKLLRTYVMRDSPELAERPGTSSHAAVVWF